MKMHPASRHTQWDHTSEQRSEKAVVVGEEGVDSPIPAALPHNSEPPMVSFRAPVEIVSTGCVVFGSTRILLALLTRVKITRYAAVADAYPTYCMRVVALRSSSRYWPDHRPAQYCYRLAASCSLFYMTAFR